MSNETLVSAVPVTEIIVHDMELMAHLDEASSVCILRMFGDEKFTGIFNAKVVLYDKNLHDGDWFDQLHQHGRLRVGCGGKGDPLDEHQRDGSSDNECATSLVMKFLEMREQNERLDLFVEKVLNSDANASPHVWHAEQVIKKIGSINDFDEVISWLSLYLYALLKTDYRGCDGPAKNFDRIAAGCLAEREGGSIRRAQEGRSMFVATLYGAGLGQHQLYSEIQRLMKQCTEENGRPGHPMHVAAMVETMHRSGKVSAEALKGFVRTWLEAEIAEQQQFLDAKEFIAQGGAQIIKVCNHKSGKPLVLCVGETDNKAFGKAARLPKIYGGPVEASMVFQIRSGVGGHFFIAPNYQVFNSEDMVDLIKSIRVAEEELAAEEGERETAFFDDALLTADGFVTNDRWYFQAASGITMNGSLTNSQVEKARLDATRIRELCETFLSEVTVPEVSKAAQRRQHAQDRGQKSRRS
ncbi:MAG: hypothetical protein Q7S57_00775 [bacterium]|nr:hypothetical protein [bacterium]